MDKINNILRDAQSTLEEKEGIEVIDISFLEGRVFSKIYNIKGIKNNEEVDYILKISLTSRSCESEYFYYQYLKEKNIRAPKPIFFSETYNYLITEKEDIRPLLSVLSKERNEDIRRKYFFKLGELFKSIDIKTGEDQGSFDSEEYLGYIMPRIDRLIALNPDQKSRIKNGILTQVKKLELNKPRFCLVSDYSLCNLHINSSGEFVLIDMGDAEIGNRYDNIAFIQLNCSIDLITRYFDIKKKTKAYFQAFLNGYEIQDFDEKMFCLYKIKHLVNMISFISSLDKKSGSVRQMLSTWSNRFLIYKYKKHLNDIVSLENY